MKKVFATILAILYLSTSMGVTIHLHYCMGKLFSWGITDKDNGKCGQCGMPRNGTDGRCMAIKGGCCKDTQTVVKVDKDQKTTESAYTFFTPSPDLLLGNLINLPDRFIASFIVDHPTTNAPPDPDKVPLFIRNCHFRI